jgi:hypothetical protein
MKAASTSMPVALSDKLGADLTQTQAEVQRYQTAILFEMDVRYRDQAEKSVALAETGLARSTFW